MLKGPRSQNNIQTHARTHTISHFSCYKKRSFLSLPHPSPAPLGLRRVVTSQRLDLHQSDYSIGDAVLNMSFLHSERLAGLSYTYMEMFPSCSQIDVLISYLSVLYITPRGPLSSFIQIVIIRRRVFISLHPWVNKKKKRKVITHLHQGQEGDIISFSQSSSPSSFLALSVFASHHVFSSVRARRSL